ncbi:MAG TPA: metallophosphoesterase [Bryobacteraceae bacterium]|nr:metallophosphoesterase [Bryobacteraceae bacterium]
MWKLALYFFWIGTALCADFHAGLDAYHRGDYAGALREWQPLADQGDANTQFNVALLYARGLGVPKDPARAAEYYRKAAEQGVAAAQYNLGVMCANGDSIPRNLQEAANWFAKAADQGVPNAAANLGRLYNDFQGIKNPAEAAKWYRKAADEGVPSAAFDLGLMYDRGQGVQQDYAEAMKWYQKAADEGFPSAMTNIGVLYYNAQGVKRDLVQAYAWISRGQKAGDPRGAELLQVTADKMKPEEIKSAQQVATQWQPAAKQHAETAADHLFSPPPAAERVASAASTVKTQPAAGPARPDGKESERGAAAPVQSVWTGVDRVVAVGDVHGDYEQFVKVLRSAGLVDQYANWTGGRTHLVQTGDVVDRGTNSRAVLDLLMKLEKQAAAAGGAVHCLIGNHEALDVSGDLRYVSAADFAAFGSEESGANREAVTARATPTENGGSGQPGAVEYRAAFGPTGQYGRWIRSHNAVIKIDRTLFVHAGIGPSYAGWTIDRINEAVRRDLEGTGPAKGIAMDPNGPLWYTGLAEGNEAQLQPVVDQVLKNFGADQIVIGHIYTNGAITPRFGGKVLLIDVGVPRIYDNMGQVGCLEIDQGHPYALHRGQKLELPKDENGPDMLRYLEQAAALDPRPSPLLPRIDALKLQKQ